MIHRSRKLNSLPSGSGATLRRKISSHAFVLALLLYAFLPTSFPFIFDGIPFATKVEAFGFYVVVTYVICRVFVGHIDRCFFIGRETRRLRQRSTYEETTHFVGILLSICLIFIKFFFPPSDALSVCYRSPELSGTSCLYSVEGAFVSTPAISQYTNAASYSAAHPWRLGFLNTNQFNTYGRVDRSNTADIEAISPSRFTSQYAPLSTDNFTINPYTRYVFEHPDLLKHYAKGNKRLKQTLAQWGKWHWETHGIRNSARTSPKKELSRRLDRSILFRRNDSHPFSADLRISSTMLGTIAALVSKPQSIELQITYHGVIELGVDRSTFRHRFVNFTGSPLMETITVPVDVLLETTVKYQNYICSTNSTNDHNLCLQRLTMLSIPRDHATFDIKVRTTNGQLVPLSSNILLYDSSIFSLHRLAVFFEKILFFCALFVVLIPIVNRCRDTLDIFSYRKRPQDRLFFGTTLNSRTLINSLTAGARNWFGPHPMRLMLLAIALCLFSIAYSYRALDGYWWSSFYWFSMWLLPLLIVIILSGPARTSVFIFFRNLGPTFIVSTIAIPLGYLLGLIFSQMPTNDDIILLKPGDDFLTYSSWSKDILKEKAFTREITAVAKPIFFYLRAFLYIVFGGGETFAQYFFILMRLTIAPMILAMSLVVILSKKVTGPTPLFENALSTAFFVFVVTFFTISWFNYGSLWTTRLSTEGPAWFFGLFSVLLVWPVLLLSPRRSQLYLLPSLLFGLLVISRTNYLPFVLAYVAVIVMLLHFKNIKKPLLFFLTPIFGLIAITLMQATLSDEFPEGVFLYLSHNSSMSSDTHLFDMFFPYVDKLIPLSTHGVFLMICIPFFIFFGIRFYHMTAGNGWVTRFSGITTPVVMLISLFLLQLPFLTAGYYPRTIIYSYDYLSLFILIMWSYVFCRYSSPSE